MTRDPPTSSSWHRTLRITDYVAPVIFFCVLLTSLRHASTHTKRTILNSINYYDTQISSSSFPSSFYFFFSFFFLIFFFFYGATVWYRALANRMNSPPPSIHRFYCPISNILFFLGILLYCLSPPFRFAYRFSAAVYIVQYLPVYELTTQPSVAFQLNNWWWAHGCPKHVVQIVEE